ncbi:MAG: glycosyl hydrolase [Bacteroidota bacterium]|nr:glycosyl hydrolase [Bacteroidota bacterium]
MKPIKINAFIFVWVLFLLSCNSQKKQNEQSFSPSDPKATKETVEFFSTLEMRIDKGIMLGHQDDLAYGNKWYGESGRSDVKSVCGDYPAIFGWNVGNVENGSLYNSDSVSFSKLAYYVKRVNKMGGVSTLTWLVHNPVTGGEYNDYSGNHVVKEILSGNSSHEKYLQYLDGLANFLNSLKDEKGRLIPVIFQPFHEHNISGKYWWNTNQCTAEEFKKMWIMTVDYLRNKKDVHHILYAYSIHADTSSTAFADYYPGNNYVDLIGVSLNLVQESDPSGKIYMQTLNRNLAVICQFAEKNKKISAVTDTGLEGVKISNYFSNYVYPIISQYKLSYIMFGRNAWDDENHYYIPIPGHPASEDFNGFSKSPKILTCSKIQ